MCHFPYAAVFTLADNPISVLLLSFLHTTCIWIWLPGELSHKSQKLKAASEMKSQEQNGCLTGQRTNPLSLILDLLSGSVLVNGFRRQNIHCGDCLCKKILQEGEFSSTEIMPWTLDTCWDALLSQGTETILLDLHKQLWWTGLTFQRWIPSAKSP